MAGDLDLQRLALARRDRDVEIPRVGRDPVDRTAPAAEIAAYHAHHRAIVFNDLRDVAAADVLIPRRGHLERGGEIRPQLEPVHPALLVALGHLLMDDAAAG